MSSLKEDTQPLPSNVTTAIFRTLHLSTEKKKAVLPLLERPEGLSIAEIRKYTSDRFRTYQQAVANHKKTQTITTMRSMVVLDSLMEPPQNQMGKNKGREGKEDQVGKKREMEAIRQTLSKKVEESTQQIV